MMLTGFITLLVYSCDYTRASQSSRSIPERGFGASGKHGGKDAAAFLDNKTRGSVCVCVPNFSRFAIMLNPQHETTAVHTHTHTHSLSLSLSL